MNFLNPKLLRFPRSVLCCVAVDPVILTHATNHKFTVATLTSASIILPLHIIGNVLCSKHLSITHTRELFLHFLFFISHEIRENGFY